jgi:methylated-DNA-protein-cysteine methyltransferase related protein
VANCFHRITLANTHRMDFTVKKKSNKNGSSISGKRKARPRARSSDQSVPDKFSKIRIRIEAAIRRIPRGKVSTYGAIARAAGLPGKARQVAQTLHRGFNLPWHRVLGAGGEIKLRGDSAIEQRLRLEAEGVHFRGRKVDMKQHEFKFNRASAGPS